MTNYRLINEGEERPTGITATPLGSTSDARPATATHAPAPDYRQGRPTVDYTQPRPTVPPPHRGVLAVHVDRHGNRFGVDVYRMNRAWAKFRIIHAPGSRRMLIGTEHQTASDRIQPVESGDLFWWHWPSFDHYDYAGKLAEMKRKAGL